MLSSSSLDNILALKPATAFMRGRYYLLKKTNLEGINWKRGFKSSFSFGISGIILMLYLWIKIDLGLWILIILPGISGLIFSYLLQEELNNNYYFLISPVIITAGFVLSVIGYLAVYYSLPAELKNNGIHFFWMSGFICSSILGILFSLTHPIEDKIKTATITIVCCTGLSLFYGGIYETEKLGAIVWIWIAATVWLMVFGLIVGLKMKATGTNPNEKKRPAK